MPADIGMSVKPDVPFAERAAAAQEATFQERMRPVLAGHAAELAAAVKRAREEAKDELEAAHAKALREAVAAACAEEQALSLIHI